MGVHCILHVLGTAEPGGKAVCQIVENLATALDPEKYHVEVCFLKSGEFADRFNHLGIKSTCIDWNASPTDPIGAGQFAKILRSSDFGLIHLHTGGRFLTQMIRTLTHARIVRHVHGRISEATGIVESRLDLPDRDALIANSQIVADSCRDSRAVVIYPGINVDHFLRDRGPESQTVIGTACRLEPVKGIGYLIQSIAMLAECCPQIRLEIAGNGSMRSSLEDEAKREGISDRVSFLGWQPDMPSVMASWSIFVLPSLDEGFGVAALEAMAAGLPVVATAVGGLRELVENEATGFLCAPGSTAELAARIRQLVEDPELRITMGAAGRRRAVERFSQTEMARKTIHLYDSLFERQV
jgi:glycosyltransferase involved in cell wall biosynthesis